MVHDISPGVDPALVRDDRRALIGGAPQGPGPEDR
jgi:hypothetical protein